MVIGANGSGKSNLYKALHLLADTAFATAIQSIAREGGLPSVFWAGLGTSSPGTFSKEMRAGAAPVQGGPRQQRVSLSLDFAGEQFSYSIDFGLAEPQRTMLSPMWPSR